MSEIPGPAIIVKSEDDILLDRRIPLNMIEVVKGALFAKWARLEQRVPITCPLREFEVSTRSGRSNVGWI